MMIDIWTDGAVSAKKKDKPGGYGCVYVYENVILETLSGGEYDTTNQRMELMAVICGLEQALGFERIRKIDVEMFNVISDSAYIVNCMLERWYVEWKINNWVTSSLGTPVKNKDLWERLLLIIESLKKDNIKVRWTKTKGHVGNMFNEVADRLAVNAKKSL